MKRVIEKGNLAFNELIHICDLCKRWKGDFTKDDKRVCKYNKDGKGLKTGLTINQMENFKCKYYKRASKYRTCRLQSKNYKTNKNGIKQHIIYKKGKFKITKIESW